MMRRLRYRLSNSVVWEPQKFSIEKITRHFRFLKMLENLRISAKNIFERIRKNFHL